MIASPRPRILIVDDVAVNVVVLAECLAANYDVLTARSGVEGLMLAHSHRPDLILLDISMPEMDGYEVCRRLKASPDLADIPVIFVTTHKDAEHESHGFEFGAVDFIHKPIHTRVVNARVQLHLSLKEKERSLSQMNTALEKLAQDNLKLTLMDALTDTYNRRRIDQMLPVEMERANRYDRPLSIVFCDIDHFKSVNDQHGHGSGDEVLSQFAHCLKTWVRQGADWVARYGGEEFLLVLPETTGQGAFVLAERLRQSVQETVFAISSGESLSLSASFAVVEHQRTENFSSLIERADRMLYLAKNSGRNRVVC